ncbi:threonine/serine dehydratase [Kineosporia succinea]|uniref:Threonine dehydratase n=1 Tax=Kineosporia succinea TaxID=84632 RepID=A0ABT9P636_9ACTN|nr:threonine/serine dehydratase [Kineosporia succinea]MDP9827942.1 threonine dehydratase [Kineosporia succinea]
MISRDDVLTAGTRIARHVRRTPLLQADGLWFKCEFLQRTGVFKARGAFNRQLAARERGELDAGAGVVTASGGNAGLAHAHAASVLGVRATVFVPQTAPAVKVARLRAYGAEVVQVGSEYAEAYAAAIEHVADTGALFCHAYDQPEIAAGAGTVAEEILDDAEVDTLVVAVGGGGLFAGIAASAQGRARVVAVEPENCPTLRSALDHGGPADISVSGVAADSLGARRIGDIGWDLARRTEPTSVLVTDEAIVEARTKLWADYRIPAEHGAAAAYAALTSGAYVPAEGERVAVIICGANTDASTLG